MARKSLLICGNPLVAALRRHDDLRGDAMGGLQLRFSNHQRAVRDRRSDAIAVGGAGRDLYRPCDRLRMGRLEIGGSIRALRIAGGLILAYGSLGVLWPFAPMHLRETLAAGGGTLSDTMHLVSGECDGSPHVARDRCCGHGIRDPFRLYSLATLAILAAFGALTFLDAPGIAANLAHAVDRRVGAHQPRSVPALGGRAGGHPSPRAGCHRGKQPPGSFGRVTTHCTPVGCRSSGGSLGSPRETFAPGFRQRVTSVESRFSARSGIGVAGLRFLEIARDDQLECQAVRRVGQADADAGLDVPGLPRAIDDAVELMHLLGARERTRAPDR